MNAVLSNVLERPAAETSPLGEISAAWQITPETLLVLGWQQDRPAVEGIVTHQKPGAQRGRFRSISWPFGGAGAGAHHFVAALQLPAGEPVRAGETLVLTGQNEPAGVLGRLPARFSDTREFAVELGRLAAGAGHAVAVTGFLTKMFGPAVTRGNADIRGMLLAFLERASAPDGCIEMVGAIEDHCVILQGWGAPPGPSCEVVVIGSSVERCMPRLALFARSDLRGTAVGQTIVLPAAAARDMAQIEAVVVLDRRGMRWRPMITERQVLAPQETVNHLLGALPTYQCDPATRAALQASLRPRFNGRFTMYDGGHPVRIALDSVVAGAGAGTYLTGWLYDPAAVVAEVRLCSTGGGSARLDGNWTRIAREDVSDAFCNDAVLPRPAPGQNRHGFAIHIGSIAAPADGGALYLDVAYRDGSCGFMPLTVADAADASVRHRLLAGVDLHKPSGMQIIEGQLAPFFARQVVDGGKCAPVAVSPVPAEWATAIVVPLSDAALPRAMLSQFLRDPLGREEGVVFVFGENWSESTAESVRSLASFYGVTPALLCLAGVVTAATALAAVASASPTVKRLLLLDPGAVGCSPGWRGVLHAALDAAGGGACVSPTVVYEDYSIRFAGTAAIEKLEAAPYVRIRRRLAGMPASLITTAEPEPSITASLACCLIPREAIRALGAATGVAATPSMQEADLFLRLRRNGLQLLWTPAAQVYASDRSHAETCDNGGRVARLVDGWCLRARLAAEG